MKIKGRHVFSILLAMSLIIVFSISALSQQLKKYKNKDGSYRVEYVLGTTPIYKEYYNKDGSKSRVEHYDVDGKLESTTYFNSDGTESRIEYPDGTTITYTYNSDGSPSRAVYSDGTTITYNTDGSYTVRRPDGSRVEGNTDGSLTEYDKNGKIVQKLDYKEDTDSTRPYHYKVEKDGSITYYTYNKKDNSYRKEFTEHADGRVTRYDENGNVTEVFYPVTMVRVEGSTNKDLYGGSVKETSFEEDTNPGEKLPEGKNRWKLYYTKNKDGSRSYWRTPNTETLPLFVVHPDGSVTYYNDRYAYDAEALLTLWSCNKKYTKHPDGSKTYYFEDRKTYTTHPDGSVTYYVEEKKHKTEHPDGSTTYYDEDEKVMSFRDPDGNHVFYDEDGNITKVEHPDGSETHYRNGKKDYTEDFGKRSYYHEELSRSQMYAMKFWNGPTYADEHERTWIPERKTGGDDIFNEAPDMTPKTYTDKDGNEVTEYPNGTKEYTDKKGNKVTENSSIGTKTVCKKDGSCTNYDENGNILWEIDKNGKTTYYDKDGKTAASETPEGDVVFYESFFGDSAWKAIMEEYRIETDKNGSYIMIRTDWETGNVDAPPPNEGDAGEIGSFDVGTPTPEPGGDAETGSFDVGTPTPDAGGDAETGSFDVGTPTPEPGGDAETGSFDVGTPTPDAGGDAETGSFDVGTPTPEPGGETETGSFDVGTPTPKTRGDAETGSFDVGTPTPDAGGDAETGSFDVGTPTPDAGGDAETGSFDVAAPTPEPGGETETGSFDVGTPVPDAEGETETGSFDVGTPTPDAGGDTGTDSSVIGTPTPGAPDGYIEDENGNRTYYDAYGIKEYTTSKDGSLLVTYNPDGTIDRIEDNEEGSSTTFFYENDTLHHTFNSGTGATTYYNEEGAGIYRENLDGSVTELDGIGGVGTHGGLSEEAILLFGATGDHMEPGVHMGMGDDPFNEGMPPGMETFDNGAPYEMIDTGVGGSGGTEMLDDELLMDDGSMTLE